MNFFIAVLPASVLLNSQSPLGVWARKCSEYPFCLTTSSTKFWSFRSQPHKHPGTAFLGVVSVLYSRSFSSGIFRISLSIKLVTIERENEKSPLSLDSGVFSNTLQTSLKLPISIFGTCSLSIKSARPIIYDGASIDEWIKLNTVSSRQNFSNIPGALSIILICMG